MIRIQKLVEPKKSSGKKLLNGKTYNFHGVVITNNNKFPIYVDYYVRKKPAPKLPKKIKKSK